MPAETPTIKNIEDILIYLLANVKKHAWQPSRTLYGNNEYSLILPAKKILNSVLLLLTRYVGNMFMKILLLIVLASFRRKLQRA
jgi:hypothetical protein